MLSRRLSFNPAKPRSRRRQGCRRTPPRAQPAPSPTGCGRPPCAPPPPISRPPPYLSWRGSQSTPGSSSRAAWRTSSLSMEKLRRWPACATATRIHSISGGSTRKGLRRGRDRDALGGPRWERRLRPTPTAHRRPPTPTSLSPPPFPWRPCLSIQSGRTFGDIRTALVTSGQALLSLWGSVSSSAKRG